MASSLPLVLGTEKFIIKPFCTTPSHVIRDYELSFIDQSFSHMYMPFSLFYSKQHQNESNIAISNDIQPDQMSYLLQDSLSRTLASYYPFAGRLKDNTTIDCNDMGVEFFDVQIKCPMSEFLKCHRTEAELAVFPKGLPHKNSCDGSLLAVQLNQFDCGGIAIGVGLSHKLGDGSSMVKFLSDWGKTTRNPNFVPSPRFVGESIFPSSKIFKGDQNLIASLNKSKLEECVDRPFFFANSKIRALKAKVEGESRVQNPTRAELVSALIFKCATRAAASCHKKQNRENTTSFKPCKLVNYVDLRQLLNPRLPQSCIGNIISTFSITTTHKKEMQLPRLVSKLRNEVDLLVKKDHVSQNELVLTILESIEKGKNPIFNNDMDTYLCSNMCTFPFYDIDFGMGKPKRVRSAPGPYKNSFYLIYDKINGGVVAKINSDPQQMSALECDEEFLEFASPVTGY